MGNSIVSRLRDSYQWRSGSRFSIDPGVVGARLEEIATANGGQITTEAIANEATNPNSPLYELFERDIEVAAFEYHRYQARNIINSLVIVTVIPAAREEREYQSEQESIIIDINQENEAENSIPVVARAFPSVLTGGQRYYTPLQVVLHDGALRDQSLTTIYNELKAMARKAKDFKIFTTVVAAIEELPELQVVNA